MRYTLEELSGWDRTLRSLGGEKHEPLLPYQLQVFRPENHGGADWMDAGEWEFCEATASCLKWTERGHRAFVYVTGGEDAHLAAVVDYQEAAVSHPAFKFAASAVYTPLHAPISRADLQAAHPDLA